MTHNIRPLAKKKTSVVLIVHTYPPVLGGSELEAQRVAEELVRRGHKVLVLCAGGPPMPEAGSWVDEVGLPVRILTQRRDGRLAAIRFALGVGLYLWRQRRDTQIAYFLMPGLHLTLGLPLANSLGMRSLMKFSGSNTIRPLVNSLAGRLEIVWFRRFRIPVLVLNHGMVEEAESVGIPREQLSLMPNPIDIGAFRPAKPSDRDAIRERFGIPQTTQLLTYVGRLSHEKGLVELVDGFAVAAKNSPKFELCLVGDGPFRPVVEARASSLGIPADQIRFVGRVRSGEVPLWLQASDAFALVSPNEGFSCALAEAMATGLPAIVSEIPANTQLVQDGVHGFTVPFGDTKALGDAIQEIFTDDSLRQRMGEAAREEIVRNYSLENVVDRYERLFEEVLGR